MTTTAAASAEDEDAAATDAPQEEKTKPRLHVPSVVWIVLAVIAALGALIGGLVAVKIHIEKKEEAERLAVTRSASSGFRISGCPRRNLTC